MLITTLKYRFTKRSGLKKYTERGNDCKNMYLSPMRIQYGFQQIFDVFNIDQYIRFWAETTVISGWDYYSRLIYKAQYLKGCHIYFGISLLYKTLFRLELKCFILVYIQIHRVSI